MRTVELFEQALAAAERLGYQIRYEHMGGNGGGACEFGGKKWLFIDLALNAAEQLEQVTEALREEPGIQNVEMPGALSRMLGIRKAA